MSIIAISKVNEHGCPTCNSDRCKDIWNVTLIIRCEDHLFSYNEHNSFYSCRYQAETIYNKIKNTKHRLLMGYGLNRVVLDKTRKKLI